MAQILKADVRERIVAAARDSFFERGYDATAMAAIAGGAGVAVANIYRYFPDKAALFEAVLPDEFIEQHDRLLDARIDALVEPVNSTPSATQLLDFWVEHRLAVATLLDHDGVTSRSFYRRAFVERLVDHVQGTLDTPLTPPQRQLLTIVFDNTRRAIATILRTTVDPGELRELIAGFWAYQVPGLESLTTWIRSPSGLGPT